MIHPPEPTDELLGVLHLASELAGRLRHAEVTPDHVLMAMTRDRTAAGGFRAAGVDPQRLETDLREFLSHTAPPARTWQMLGPSYAPSLRRVLDQTMARLSVAGRDVVGVGEVLAALLREEVPSSVAVREGALPRGAVYRESRHLVVHPVHRLRQSGFCLVDLLGWIAHGAVHGVAADVASQGVPEGADLDPVWVVLHNDDFTTFEFVRDVLCNDFDMPADEADGVSRSVHVHGSEIVAGFVRAVALVRVRRALDRARAAGFPLRITVEDQGPVLERDRPM